MSLSKYFVSFCLITLIGSSCTTWKAVVHRGEVQQAPFDEVLPAQIIQGLFIVPITIEGISYNFLFDTGSINAISSEIQERHGFKKIGRGWIIDSEKNRSRIDYIKIDQLNLGDVNFLDESFFVTDFHLNPVLDCMQIDGIIGSNLMRSCNWTVNYDLQTIRLTDKEFVGDSNLWKTIDFTTDAQFNIQVDLITQQMKLRKITLDYGSNSGLTLSENDFNSFKQKGEITDIRLQIGVSQSGLHGKVNPGNEELGVIYQSEIGDLKYEFLPVRTGVGNLLGTKALSHCEVFIDWKNRQLHVKELHPQSKSELDEIGFRIGVNKQSEAYIQSIIEGSSADEAGIKPHAIVWQIDEFDFQDETTFCSYVLSQIRQRSQISITFQNPQGKVITRNLKRKPLANYAQDRSLNSNQRSSFSSN